MSTWHNKSMVQEPDIDN
jgi:hypothetical protein